jgi:hypothetical protein
MNDDVRTPTKPKAFNGDLSALPAALRPLTKLPRWVVWKWVKKNPKAKWTKPPYKTSDPQRNAANNNPSTWGSYEEAVAQVVERNAANGIGFALLDSEVGAVDLDDARDPETEKIADWAQAIIDRAPADAYVEVTVSGTGFRIIGTTRHREKEFQRKFYVGGGSYEVYGAVARYITISGLALDGRDEEPLPNIDALLEELIEEGDKAKAAAEGQKSKSERKEKKPGERKALPKNLETMLLAPDNGNGQRCGAYETRHGALFGFIKLALEYGIDENEIVEVTNDSKYAGCGIYEHCQEEGGEKYVRGQIDHALSDGEPAERAKKKNLPIIRLHDGNRTGGITDIMEDRLKKANCPVYYRGGKLVEPIWRPEKTAEKNRDTLVTKFLQLIEPRLSYMIDKHAVHFQKYNERKRQWVFTDPPQKSVEQLLALGHWGSPTAKGISNAPIMRYNGSLFTEKGYDKETELWYMPAGDLELSVPKRPTRERAEEALATIRQLLSGFPFREEDNGVSEAVALAGVMTPVLRGAFDCAPAYLFLAPESGTGKTYLVTTISMIATGRIPSAVVGCANKEEMEKRLSAAAFEASPILHLNNLDFDLESVLLNQMVTEGKVKIRSFGQNKELSECDCQGVTVFINGNNIAIVGDMVRRTLTGHLDAQLENPEERAWKFDPVDEVKKDRGKYLAAVYTIARAYMEAGCPPQDVASFAGFGGWSKMVRYPLIWLGMPDPVESKKEARANDPKRQGLYARRDALLGIFGTEETFTTASVGQKTQEMISTRTGNVFRNQELRDAFTGQKGLSSGSIGEFLKADTNRLNGGYRLIRVSHSTKGSVYRMDGPPWKARKDDEM